MLWQWINVISKYNECFYFTIFKGSVCFLPEQFQVRSLYWLIDPCTEVLPYLFDTLTIYT